MDEIRDHLVDATDHWTEHGLDHVVAEQRAVDAAGGVDAVAPAIRGTLSLVLVRRCVMALIALLACEAVFWQLVMAADPEASGAVPPLIRTIQVLSWSSMVAGFLGLILTTRMSRRGVDPTHQTRILARIVVASVGSCGVLAITQCAAGSTWSGWAITLSTTLLPFTFLALCSSRAAALTKPLTTSR